MSRWLKITPKRLIFSKIANHDRTLNFSAQRLDKQKMRFFGDFSTTVIVISICPPDALLT